MTTNPKASSRPKKNHSLQDDLSHLAKAIIANAGIGIYIVQNGKFVYVSELYQKLSGYTDTELLGTYSLNYIYSDDRDMVREEAIKCLKGESFEPYEYRFVKKNNEIMWVLETITPIVYKEERATLGSFIDITGRKKVEEKLRNEEQRFRAFAEQSSDIIVIVNRERVITYENPAIARSLGLNPEERIGANVFDNIHPDDFNIVTAAFNTLFADTNAPAQQIAVRLRNRNGSWNTFEAVASNLVYDNVVEAVMVNLRDITERKRAEEELRENEDKYRTLIETTDTGYVIIDQDGLVRDANSEYVRLTGHHDLSKIVGRCVLEWTAESQKEKNAEAVKACFDKGYIRNLEIDYVDAKGNLTPIEINATCIEIEGKKHTITICRDISQRKRAEETLRISEERFRGIASNLPGGVFQFFVRHNGEMGLNYLSDNARDLLGLSNDPQKYFPELVTCVIPEEKERFLNSIDEAVRSISRWNFEGRYIKPTGEEMYLRGISAPIEFEDKLIFNGVILDMTERKQAEEALRKSQQRYLELSMIDDLTQLYNSRHFYAQLSKETERSNRYEQPLTLLLLDLDKFKDFNDTYGHVEGDYVLSKLGQVIKRCLRETDSAYRYGGEEFTIMLPMTTSEEGMVTAQRIQTELREEAFLPDLDKEVYMTVSIGVAQYKPKEEIKEFVNRVDKLMYQAKENGRDRIFYESQQQEQFKW